MKLYYDIFETSLGNFGAAVNEHEAVVGAGFGGKDALPRWNGDWVQSPKAVAAAREQIEEYVNGNRHEFTLTLAPRGTAFQQLVWAALRGIPFGETRSYGHIAKELGKPAAARAIGQAVGSNPICIIIPCHRVIASDGSLGGFAYGVKLKRQLLELEMAELDVKLR